MKERDHRVNIKRTLHGKWDVALAFRHNSSFLDTHPRLFSSGGLILATLSDYIIYSARHRVIILWVFRVLDMTPDSGKSVLILFWPVHPQKPISAGSTVNPPFSELLHSCSITTLTGISDSEATGITAIYTLSVCVALHTPCLLQGHMGNKSDKCSLHICSHRPRGRHQQAAMRHTCTYASNNVMFKST